MAISKIRLNSFRLYKRKKVVVNVGVKVDQREAENIPPVVKIVIMSYTDTEFIEQGFLDFKGVVGHLEKYPEYKHWVDVIGSVNPEFQDQFSKYFKVHDLIMEDILSHTQRSKVEEADHFLFMISRMLYFTKDDALINEQVSFIVFENILITFQDELDDCFEPVREKLRKNKGNIRNDGAFLCAYNLTDAIVDNYFPMLDKVSDHLDLIEEELMTNPNQDTMNKIQEVKRKLIFLKKFIRPERDKITEMLQYEFMFIKEKHKIYLRDTNDHAVQIMDLVETYREISYSLMDVYLSSVSNKMNEVMKVLTVISSIFIPLTFIVGVYGMNFPHTDDEGKILRWSMPELYSPYGYLEVLIVMAVIAIGQIIFFKKKGWF